MGGNMSLREKAVMATVGVVVLYSIAVATWFLSAEGSWKKASKTYARERSRFEQEEKLIGETQKWKDDYETERQTMSPISSDNRSADTFWLRKVEDMAKRHLVDITGIKAEKENEADDVFELEIKVQRYEASLQALVEFIYELETSDQGMFDVKQISIAKQNAKKGYLSGSFTVTCAYMKN